MLKLKNVSKFYYNKGVVASGFTKINLDFNIGEFAVITGESGSGKSTLLNVISGLDTYEEGEMYINGEETSYYGESDFEEYRKKYIANIFQNFNLINSYTVYQNIELVLLLNGYRKEEIKPKIEDLLKQVDLYKYKNTKASKLSGGQKQRVAIARALAKETPIIVADEPTGNLDTNSANSIMKLLYEISKNKLVIIVTHNYEQVSTYATRKIKMHDGKILEDVKLQDIKKEDVIDKTYGNITFINKMKLSIRNTFNIIPKFLLLLLVYLFLTIAVIGEYSSIMKNTYDTSLNGNNRYFSEKSDKRIVVKKNDNSIFNDEDYKKISNINNVDYIFKKDALLDSEMAITDDDFYMFGRIGELSKFDGELDYGRMPTSDNEIIVLGSKYEYYLNSEKERTIEKEFKIVDDSVGYKITDYNVKIVGIKYYTNEMYDTTTKFYISDKVLNDLNKTINKNYSNIETVINNSKILKIEPYSNMYNIYPSDNVEKGKALISDNLVEYCKNYYCINNTIDITIKNLYYTDTLNLVVSNTYNKDNIKKLTGYDNIDIYSSYTFINKEDYYKLFDKENYQLSVYVKDNKEVYKTIETLENFDYTTLYVKDTLVDYTKDIMVFVRIIQFVGILVALVALFFISYFIIKIILKSRNTYFSTTRMLGAFKKDIKTLINLELNLVLNIAYILVIIFLILVNNNIINITYIKDIIGYLKISDYIVLYIILFVISFVISNRYGRKLFKKSAMKTYREV